MCLLLGAVASKYSCFGSYYIQIDPPQILLFLTLHPLARPTGTLDALEALLSMPSPGSQAAHGSNADLDSGDI